jgi:flagellar motor protein MotB
LPAEFTSVWAFSAARAASVAQTLEDKCGVSAARLSAVGHGLEKLSSEAAKRMPSRIEIELEPAPISK